LINNLTVFIDDGDLNKLQNTQAYIPSLNSSSTSNNNNNDNNNNKNEESEEEEEEEEEEIEKTKTLSIIKTLSIAFYAVFKNKETNEDEYQVGYKYL
jgi:Zn-finger nucleic acid-binding protein